MNNIDLTGRFAVITGGAHGVGYAVAQRIIASGGRVALWDIDPGVTASAETLSAETVGIVVDLTDEHAVAAATEQTEGLFGRIDILVNSAGIAGSSSPVVTYSAEEWRRVIDVDLTAVFLCCRAVVAGMTSRNYGRVVNISSVAGKEGNPNAAPYSAAKARVIAPLKRYARVRVTGNCDRNSARSTDPPYSWQATLARGRRRS